MDRGAEMEMPGIGVISKTKVFTDEVCARTFARCKKLWHGLFFWNRPLRTATPAAVDLSTREAWLAAMAEERKKMRNKT